MFELSPKVPEYRQPRKTKWRARPWLMLSRHLWGARIHRGAGVYLLTELFPFLPWRRAGKGWREGKLFPRHFFQRAELFTGD